MSWNKNYGFKQREVAAWPVGKYRLHERSEMPPRPGADRALLEEGAEVWYDGQPGPHMEPLDDQAHANVAHVINALGGFKPLDPTANLSMIMGEVDDGNARVAELEAQIAAIRAGNIGASSRGAPGAVQPPPQVAPSTLAQAPVPVPLAVVPGQGGNRDAVPTPAYLLPGRQIPAPPPLARAA